MKNIHVLPKKSFNQIGVDHYGKTRTQIKIAEFLINKNIYITSDEEIKEGVNQWYLDKVLNEPYNSGGAQYSSKQNVIILTTDQSLDGVQKIDDEFLKWFVKNPSCKEVEVEEVYPLICCIQKEGKTKMNNGCMERNNCLNYKIIIPKEEPKQETVEEAAYQRAVDRNWNPNSLETRRVGNEIIEAVKFGAKWQQEQMYSEEEMLQALNIGFTSTDETWEECVEFAKEQFKKK